MTLYIFVAENDRVIAGETCGAEHKMHYMRNFLIKITFIDEKFNKLNFLLFSYR